MNNRVELVFGLVGPIGCPIHEAGEILASTLKKMDYKPVPISLSSEMDRLLVAKGAKAEVSAESILEGKIMKGNAVRKAFNNNAVLAAEAIKQIVSYRRRFAEIEGETDINKLDDRAVVPLDQHAFIIDQLKRPEEIDLLIKAFGKRFVQVSVVTPLEKRKKSLEGRLRAEQHGWDNSRCKTHAENLIVTDQNEKFEERGQRISKIFHLGDVFFDGGSEDSLESSSNRFIDAFFGKNNVAPTRDEFGSYMAKAASLRSVDLSRQVGAAILSPDGDIISIGCNEVPKYGGGNYWDEDANKKRDIDLKGEANKNEINRMIFDFLGVLRNQGLIANDMSVEDILDNQEHRKAIKGSLVSGVTEYGRMVHAEMNALSDAARLGRSTKNATIFVTTYPCHNCAKHLIAAGIERIVFVEPYPKSKVESLFADIVVPDTNDMATVSIEHFYGISPSRYRDIFEKGSRQTSEGEVESFYKETQAPRLGNVEVGSTHREIIGVLENLYVTDTPTDG
jgi:deoxycytidylate deaminase